MGPSSDKPPGGLPKPSDQTLPDSRSTSKVRCGSSAKGCPRYRRLANGCPVEHLIRERVAVQNAEVPQRLS